ncbi:MAG TPA: zinc-ribbon domain-containing protein, partial [Anaerolineales bacterium]|nr:zinc-ribbon domain-containing protein [Anaerolineales bacterium]
YFLRGREQDRPPRLRHRSAPQAETKDDRVDASPVYCHNCGTQATASDRFCRQCGTPLRV